MTMTEQRGVHVIRNNVRDDAKAKTLDRMYTLYSLQTDDHQVSCSRVRDADSMTVPLKPERQGASRVRPLLACCAHAFPGDQ